MTLYIYFSICTHFSFFYTWVLFMCLYLFNYSLVTDPLYLVIMAIIFILIKMDHRKNFLWASRLWVGRRQDQLLCYISIINGKQYSGTNGLRLLYSNLFSIASLVRWFQHKSIMMKIQMIVNSKMWMKLKL